MHIINASQPPPLEGYTAPRPTPPTATRRLLNTSLSIWRVSLMLYLGDDAPFFNIIGARKMTEYAEQQATCEIILKLNDAGLRAIKQQNLIIKTCLAATCYLSVLLCTAFIPYSIFCSVPLLGSISQIIFRRLMKRNRQKFIRSKGMLFLTRNDEFWQRTRTPYTSYCYVKTLGNDQSNRLLTISEFQQIVSALCTPMPSIDSIPLPEVSISECSLRP